MLHVTFSHHFLPVIKLQISLNIVGNIWNDGSAQLNYITKVELFLAILVWIQILSLK